MHSLYYQQINLNQYCLGLVGWHLSRDVISNSGMSWPAWTVQLFWRLQRNNPLMWLDAWSLYSASTHTLATVFKQALVSVLFLRYHVQSDNISLCMYRTHVNNNHRLSFIFLFGWLMFSYELYRPMVDDVDSSIRSWFDHRNCLKQQTLYKYTFSYICSIL